MISEAILSEVLHAYYIEKISQKRIAKKFTLPVSDKLFLMFGEYNHNEACSNCNTNLLSNFANRAHLTDRVKMPGYYYDFATKKTPLEKRIILTREKFKVYLPLCKNCAHYPDPACECQSCTELRAKTYRQLVDQYCKELITDQPSVNISSLSAKELLLAAYYHAIYQNPSHSQIGTSTQLTEINLVGISKEKLEAQMKRDGLLRIIPESVEKCIEMTSSTAHLFHKNRLKYQLVGSDNPAWSRNIKEQCRILFYDYKTRDDVIRLWGELAVSEATQHYAKLSSLYRIPFTGSPNVIAHIKSGVNDHGLFKTITAINLSIYSANKKLTEEHIAINHAKNHAQWMLNIWLNGGRELFLAGRHDTKFPEPTLVNIFCEYFLPFTTNYGKIALKELATTTETPA